MESPKVFISYSWTTPEHEQRVLDIATELVESGIDAILDKWDLKEGDDADGNHGVGSSDHFANFWTTPNETPVSFYRRIDQFYYICLTDTG